ncbi:hypothetical protein LUX39_25795 [Actinomadura madurae]|nr:hypothetical protein [Actinomadura madurae]MCQ0016740.1 hypothetical protein [Actinomadura madurae]
MPTWLTRGISGSTTIRSGHLYFATSRRSKWARTSARSISRPSRVTTKAQARSPSRSSGIATRAASAIASWEPRRSSISSVLIFSPPRLIMFLTRPSTV